MKVRLNADTCALAIVVAAQTYGDHPMQAMTARSGMRRRSIAAAAHALAEGTGAEIAQVCGVLGTSVATFKTAERENTLPFLQARHAAFVAIAPGVQARWDAPERPKAKAADHRDAIKEALDRRKAKGLVVRVGGCRAHLHLKDFDGVCAEEIVPGRLFCAPHCRAMGQKDTPVDLAPAVMPARYSERSVG